MIVFFIGELKEGGDKGDISQTLFIKYKFYLNNSNKNQINKMYIVHKIKCIVLFS